MPLLLLHSDVDPDGVFVPSGIVAQRQFLELLFVLASAKDVARLGVEPDELIEAWATLEPADLPPLRFELELSPRGADALRGWLHDFCAGYLGWAAERGRPAPPLDDVFDVIAFLDEAIAAGVAVMLVDVE